jgi:hypothetical protein
MLMLRRRRAVIVTAIALTIASGVAAQQRWFDLYDEAIEHVRLAEYEQAETKLRQAQKLGPAPGGSVPRYGMLRGPFFPDFYLGLVFLNTQRPSEALKHFALARAQKINVADKQFRLIADYENQARTLEERLAKANAITPPKPVPTDTPVETARADNPRAAPSAPADPPAPANAGVDTVALERERQRHNAEREAMQLFFGGQYGESVAVLNKAEREIGARLTTRGYFYRACALAAQALRSTRIDTKLLEPARIQYALAVREGAVPPADRRYVSPRILQALGS